MVVEDINEHLSALELKGGEPVAWTRVGDELRLVPARFALATAFASTQPHHRPKHFDELTEAAKAEKALRERSAS